MKHLSAVLMVLAVLVSACKPDPFLTMSQTGAQFTNAGGTIVLPVSSNVAWTVTTTATWFVVTKGADGASVEITARQNMTPDSRQGTATVSGEGLSVEITVEQEQLNTLVIDSDTRVQVDYNAQSVTVSLSSNFNYEVLIPSNIDWISLNGTATKAMTPGTVVLDVAENANRTARMASIMFAENGNELGLVTISQEGQPISASLKYVGVTKFTLPTISSSNIVKVLWSGGTMEYKKNTVIDLNPSGDVVEFESSGLLSISIPNIVGLEEIDLSRL